MTRLEERLRDAYQAAADTVTREPDAPDLTGTDRPASQARPGSRAPVIRLAAPLAAAAAVAAIALAMTLIGTTGSGRPPGPWPRPARWGLTAATSLAHGYPGGAIPAAPQPRYYLAIQPARLGPTEYAFTASVYNTATGQRTGQLTLPRPGLWVRAVASLGNGAYVAAATTDWPRAGCRSWLYQFRLTAAGQPTGLKPFIVPQLPGWARQLGGSGDGRVAVLTTSTCGRKPTQAISATPPSASTSPTSATTTPSPSTPSMASPSPTPRSTTTTPAMNAHDDRATAIWVPTGATTSWSPWPRASNLVPENTVPSATLSADGRLLAFVAIAGQPADFGQSEQAAYVMLTGHVDGPAVRRYRLVINPPGTGGVIAAAPSPNGQVTFVMTARSYGGRWHEQIAAYATATGKLITVLASASARYLSGDGYLVPDPSGSHLLVLGFGTSNTAMLDISTHQLTIPHIHYRNPPLGAAW
jgi:hypothetical protein